MNKTTKLITLAVIVIAVVWGMKVTIAALTVPAKYEAFAQCLKDKGAKFYGAFWCPHCQAQKKLFGSAKSKLPYVECSTPDGSGQTQICIDKKIEGYPTWELADGTRLQNENGAGITLETLSAKTSCPLP